MACVVIAYIAMADIVMACVVMAYSIYSSYCLYSHSLDSYGRYNYDQHGYGLYSDGLYSQLQGSQGACIRNMLQAHTGTCTWGHYLDGAFQDGESMAVKTVLAPHVPS